MQSLRIKISSLMALTLIAGMLLLLAGCKNPSPVAPEDTLFSNGNELHFIPIGNGNPSLMKVIQVSKLVTRQSGGQLTLQYKLPGNDTGDVQVVVTLVVKPHTISEDAELTLSMDDEKLVGNVDLAFTPHGITFSEPAILNIQAIRLDLSDINAEKIDIYYDNPETGQWEKMARKAVVVKESDGFINVVAAEIPHFSRYAVAWSR